MIESDNCVRSLGVILEKLTGLDSVIISDYPRHDEILPRSQMEHETQDLYLYGEGASEGKEELSQKVLEAVSSRFSDAALKIQRSKVELEYSYGPYGLYKANMLRFKAGIESLTHLKLGMAYEDHSKGFWRRYIDF